MIEFIAGLLGSFLGYLAFTRTNINHLKGRVKAVELRQEEKQRKLEELDKDIQKLNFSIW